MAEYIERAAVEKFIEDGLNNPDKNKAFGHDAIEIMAEIHYMPAADVAPVVHGRWEWITEDRYRCNNCGRITRVDECMGKPMYSGCPYCRAKMDLTEGRP